MDMLSATFAAVVVVLPSVGGAGGVGLTKTGVFCTPKTQVSREVGSDGKPFISGVGKAVCQQLGDGAVTVYLTQNGKEIARKTVPTMETNMIAAVTAPCVDVPETVDWTLFAQYADEEIGPTIQHAELNGSHCKAL